MRALQRRIGFGVLDRVAGFVRGDPQRGDRRRVVNVRRKTKPFVASDRNGRRGNRSFRPPRRHGSAPPGESRGPPPRR